MKRSKLHHEFQVALIEHLKRHEHLFPDLELIHANPMGEERTKSGGARLKAEGAKAGIPDLFLPVRIWETFTLRTSSSETGHEFKVIKWSGLYIEIKIGKDDLSDAQKWWKKRLEGQGFDYYVARDMMKTLDYIKAYLGG
jgi:hypothetical protein